MSESGRSLFGFTGPVHAGPSVPGSGVTLGGLQGQNPPNPFKNAPHIPVSSATVSILAVGPANTALAIPPAPLRARLRPLNKEEIARCGPAPWDVQSAAGSRMGWAAEGPMRSTYDVANTVTRVAPSGGPGGVTAPPTEFILRVRREVDSQQATNARIYGTMDIGFKPPVRPVMDEAPATTRDKNAAPLFAAADFFQQNGFGGGVQRTDVPTTGGITPGIANNPFFGRMDITQDPRNTIREARSGVPENNYEVDSYINNRVLSRESVTRFMPVGSEDHSTDQLLKSFEMLRSQNSTYVKTDTRH